MWQSLLPRVCRIAERPSASMPAKAWRAAAARTASTATWTLPSVPFLKPTGIDRPEPSWRWIWLSVVRAPIAPHETRSEMYCGVIGSRNSQPTGTPRPEDLEQEAAGHAQAGVDVARAVQVRVVDQALPADRGARLLEVDAHHDQQIVGQALGLAAQQFGVLARRLDVVHAAGTDDHHQAVVLAVQHGVRVGAAAQQHFDALIVQRQLVEELLRRDQRDEALDPLIADRVALVGADHGHHARLFAVAVHRVESSSCSMTVRKQPRRVTSRGMARLLPALGSCCRSSARLDGTKGVCQPSA